MSIVTRTGKTNPLTWTEMDANFTYLDSKIISVKGYGAVGDGVTDDTAAIQTAVNTGKAIYFPEGTYKITTQISFNTIGQKFYGAAMELSIISVSGAINGFKYSGSGLIRVFFRDLSITGNASTLNAIDFSTSTNLYESTFENLTLYCGGKAIYAPLEFNTTFINVHLSSYTDNGIEISGSNSTNLMGCYLHTFPTGKYPLRIYGNATLIGCNGVDSADYWGLFGQSVASDGVNTIFRITMIGCNVEDFKVQGVRFRYTGSASIINTTFLPPAVGTSATYDCSIYVEFTDQLITITNPTFSPKGGSTRQKLAEVFYLAGNGPLFIGGVVTSFDLNAALITAPVITVAQANSIINGVSLNNVVLGRGWGFYSPGGLTWTANATAFSVTSIDRVRTANTLATSIAQATGGIDLQELTINVRDANTTIKHNSGGAGRFMNSSAADIVATNGRPYKYISDGTVWWQV